jgi:hypothetical protein
VDPGKRGVVEEVSVIDEDRPAGTVQFGFTESSLEGRRASHDADSGVPVALLGKVEKGAFA